MLTLQLPPTPQTDAPDPVAVARCLADALGWRALDVLLAVAARRGGGVHQQEWSPALNAVGREVCRILHEQGTGHAD